MTVENFLIMTGNLLPRKHIYKDTVNSITYVCDAKHGSALTDPVWRVQKIYEDATDTDVTETDGYDNLATALATVELLTFN